MLSVAGVSCASVFAKVCSTGQIYNKSGLKFNKGTTPNGCLIRDTLYVIISQKEHSYTEVTNCGPYTWDITG